jgi:O-antigen ligase
MAAAHALSMALAWILYERGSWWGRAAAAAFVLGLLAHVVIVPFFANVKAQWLSGWIVVSVPIGLLLLFRFPRTALGLAVPAVAFFLYWKFDLVLRVYDLAEREGDFTRLTLWLDAIDLMARRPLFGVGPGNYLDYNLRYGTIGMSMSSPHGNYQQLAAETGLVGLGFALWLFYRALALGWSLFRRARDPLVRSLAIAAACSLAGQLTAAVVGDFVLPSYHNGGYQLVTSTIYAFVAMGLLISLERLDAGQARDG